MTPPHPRPLRDGALAGVSGAAVLLAADVLAPEASLLARIGVGALAAVSARRLGAPAFVVAGAMAVPVGVVALTVLFRTVSRTRRAEPPPVASPAQWGDPWAPSYLPGTQATVVPAAREYMPAALTMHFLDYCR